MAKSISRPDTPLAATPAPKMVTIGRLKQVRDSLINETTKKLTQQFDLISNSKKGYPTNKSVVDKVNSLGKKADNDIKSVTKYNAIIKKNSK